MQSLGGWATNERGTPLNSKIYQIHKPQSKLRKNESIATHIFEMGKAQYKQPLQTMRVKSLSGCEVQMVKINVGLKVNGHRRCVLDVNQSQPQTPQFATLFESEYK